MLVIYNVIWIICFILLLTSLFLLYKKQRESRRDPSTTVNQQTNDNYVIVDISENQARQPNTYYYPSTDYTLPPLQRTPSYSTAIIGSNTVEQPPPTYQEHTKDYRIPQPI
ncbi:uncharacterized protein BX663DRAFT_493192 [Cokeromyces recurvatus]|uniref:uncharacterized protein n=1 Tax=Cokeromyces recurvatus TaxID=90255 RepID=UPI00221EE0A1|nr:uncharacterized protein BX663DRAFT_493192 [Cokeromyces recurvatus]KAI7908157.1 hypothetical protein BX663DRAFT_493192 [Cokeromyces recurvatus]